VLHEDRAADMEHRDLFAEIVKAPGVRVAVMSPQMLRGSQITSLLKSLEVKKTIRWMLVDEVASDG
jgi:hypothetical protein